jgi:thymidine phosphorylase
VPEHTHPANTLRARRVRIDTHQQAVVYMRSDCHVCRSEGFEAQSRVRVDGAGGSVVAVLEVTGGGLVGEGEAGLSEAAWTRLGAVEGETLRISHPEPVASLAAVRGKIYGRRFEPEALRAVVADIAAGRYADVDLAAFIATCGGDRLDRVEIVALTQAMIAAGERLAWPRSPVVDKHCVGGLPGNRTTLLVVPIVAAAGLLMPKTSSRAITSPAGTADTMEVLAPVGLPLDAMRRVVEREGGCVVWGGAVALSPADDVLVRVERALDVDSEGQLVASVLSKKAAAGSTHVILDIPVGPTAKVRDADSGRKLASLLEHVGERVGLLVRTVISDGTQPVGRGVGPALEARDVLQVLQGEPHAPRDLRERALALAGPLLELGGAVSPGSGVTLATRLLDDGSAWRKFQAIAEAQGGLRALPPPASHRREVRALHAGRVRSIDNRDLARVAKLAGAPEARAAGIDLHTPVGAVVDRDQPLFTVHAETPGELAYALDYLGRRPPVVAVEAR